MKQGIVSKLSRRSNAGISSVKSTRAAVLGVLAAAVLSAFFVPFSAFAAGGSYSDFLTALRQRESGGGIPACSHQTMVGAGGVTGNSYHCVNNLGYMGAYQMGKPALMDVGCINKATQRWQTCNGIKLTSAADFLNNSALQDWAITEYHRKLWTSSRGYINSATKAAACNTTYNGIENSASGLLAAGHLGGAGNINTYIRSEGRIVFRDGKRHNGTPITEYITLFNGYSLPWPPNPTCGSPSAAPGTVPYTPYTPPPPRPVTDIVREIRECAGVDEADIAEDPSYNEIMQALTKERFFCPRYFVDMHDDLGALKQQDAALNALISIQMQDIYTLQEQINALAAAKAGLELEQSNRDSQTESMKIR